MGRSPEQGDVLFIPSMISLIFSFTLSLYGALMRDSIFLIFKTRSPLPPWYFLPSISLIKAELCKQCYED